MAEGTVLPLIVYIEGGIQSAALMNAKSYNKSLESKKLWIVHPETGRILPWSGDPNILELKEKQGFYTAKLPSNSESTGYTLNSCEVDIEDHNHTKIGSLKKYDSKILYNLAETISKRKKEMPSGSYTTHLFEKGLGKIKKKVGEEAIELILAESKEDLIFESADLIYHVLVLLEEKSVRFHDLMLELERRDK